MLPIVITPLIFRKKIENRVTYVWLFHKSCQKETGVLAK